MQTAVLGHPGSDTPIILPPDYDDLDRFRRVHRSDSFWCGVLLGGCGKQLSGKRYLDRVCHFAHFPDPDGIPNVCQRRHAGVGSADHLFAKRDLTAWLDAQGFPNSASLIGKPGSRDSAVAFSGSRRRHLLRVQLGSLSVDSWRSMSEELESGADHVDWLFGTAAAAAAYEDMDRRGYALRIKFETVGTARAIQVGTQFSGTEIDWADLSRCRVTRSGISTPFTARPSAKKVTPAAISPAPPVEPSPVPSRQQALPGPGAVRDLEAIAAKVRQALVVAARGGYTLTWDHLAKRVGIPVSSLSEPDRRQILALVDRTGPAGGAAPSSALAEDRTKKYQDLKTRFLEARKFGDAALAIEIAQALESLHPQLPHDIRRAHAADIERIRTWAREQRALAAEGELMSLMHELGRQRTRVGVLGLAEALERAAALERGLVVPPPTVVQAVLSYWRAALAEARRTEVSGSRSASGAVDPETYLTGSDLGAVIAELGQRLAKARVTENREDTERVCREIDLFLAVRPPGASAGLRKMRRLAGRWLTAP
ncbi:hypothetical protein [Streptomyces sp. LS1784]|uniref:hypothetical protein n=1 Tax=Streptomyces sp. LS1784 TaxID=2851533 RepID=UPI001CCE188F|nr:hypothetical protein [Streptomyces sp. LS1784]